MMDSRETSGVNRSLSDDGDWDSGASSLLGCSLSETGGGGGEHMRRRVLQRS